MLFSVCATLFSELQAESSRIEMTKLLADAFVSGSSEDVKHLCYITLGTLRPPYVGNQFNVAEKSMIKVLADLLGRNLPSYQQLVKQAGDVGKAVRDSESWPYHDAGLSLQEVYRALEQIMDISGTGAQEQKGAALKALLEQLDALSASYVCAIVIGKMRLGVSDMTVLDALSWMQTGDKSQRKELEHAYNMCADLGHIGYIAKSEGREGIKQVEPIVGIPIRLAAAERAESPAEIIERLGPCAAQPKLDGFRLQIHLDKTGSVPRCSFFSRNLHTMDNMFPDLEKVLCALPVRSLIIEGEAIVYDEETARFLPFQETVKRRRKHDIESVAESLPLRLYVFDILYKDGAPVLDQSHEERRALLRSCMSTDQDETIHVIEERLCATEEELVHYFQEQISHGLEGLVVKRIDAPYQPGKRNFNWIKLKRHHSGSLSDTLDCVILGYYAGKGKRAQFGIGAFLVGVYNPETEQYQTIAKIGTGLSDEQWIALKALCDTQMVAEQPQNVVCLPELSPDVWVAPTFVVVVLADEITQSPMHTAGKTDIAPGLALRFPRYIGPAADKEPEQATNVAEARRLYELQYSS